MVYYLIVVVWLVVILTGMGSYCEKLKHRNKAAAMIYSTGSAILILVLFWFAVVGIDGLILEFGGCVMNFLVFGIVFLWFFPVMDYCSSYLKHKGWHSSAWSFSFLARALHAVICTLALYGFSLEVVAS